MVRIGAIVRGPEPAPDPVAAAAMRLRERTIRKVPDELRARMLEGHGGALAEVIGCDACCRTASEYLDRAEVIP